MDGVRGRNGCCAQGRSAPRMLALSALAAQAAITIDDVQVAESNGTVSATFTIARSGQHARACDERGVRHGRRVGDRARRLRRRDGSDRLRERAARRPPEPAGHDRGPGRHARRADGEVPRSDRRPRRPTARAAPRSPTTTRCRRSTSPTRRDGRGRDRGVQDRAERAERPRYPRRVHDRGRQHGERRPGLRGAGRHGGDSRGRDVGEPRGRAAGRRRPRARPRPSSCGSAAAQAALRRRRGVGAATVLRRRGGPAAGGRGLAPQGRAAGPPSLRPRARQHQRLAGARGAPGGDAISGSSGLGVSAPRLRRPRTGIAVTLACPPRAGRCKGRLTIFSRPSRRSKIKLLRSEAPPGAARVRARRRPHGGTLLIALGRRDRSLLRRVGRMKVRAYVVTQDRAGRTGVVRRVNGTLVARTAHSS